MDGILGNEGSTQSKLISFFEKELGYKFIGNLSDKANTNVRNEELLNFLTHKMGYSDILGKKAIEELVKATQNLQSGLYNANKEVYNLLKYGAKVKETVEAAEKTVYFIDFNTVGNNHFSVAEEVTIVETNTKRPDLVVYVNGIAIAVIELKRSAVSVEEGIRQNLTNQREMFIEGFF